MRKESIHTIGAQLLETNRPYQIEEKDNCIVVDNFVHNLDVAEKNLLKIPSTNCHEINEIFYYGEKEVEYVGTPGITQIVAKDFIPYYVKSVYDCLSEKDYMIANPNNDHMFDQALVAQSAAEAVLYYEEMVVDSSCNVPSPSGGEYFSTLCFDDDTEDNKLGITFFDFVFEGRRYSSLDDFMVEDDETKEQIFDAIKDYGAGMGKLSMHQEFTENEYFKPTEYIPAKKNRLIAFKSTYFHIKNFTSGERYSLNCSFNTPKFD